MDVILVVISAVIPVVIIILGDGLLSYTVGLILISVASLAWYALGMFHAPKVRFKTTSPSNPDAYSPERVVEIRELIIRMFARIGINPSGPMPHGAIPRAALNLLEHTCEMLEDGKVLRTYKFFTSEAGRGSVFATIDGFISHVRISIPRRGDPRS
jgi:hypothetical protein